VGWNKLLGMEKNAPWEIRRGMKVGFLVRELELTRPVLVKRKIHRRDQSAIGEFIRNTAGLVEKSGAPSCAVLFLPRSSRGMPCEI